MTGHTVNVDTLGLRCPLPILQMKKALAKMAVGDILLLKTDDPHAPEDVQAFCRQTKHRLLKQDIQDNTLCVHHVQKSA